jgi:hypothetical protein
VPGSSSSSTTARLLLASCVACPPAAPMSPPACCFAHPQPHPQMESPAAAPAAAATAFEQLPDAVLPTILRHVPQRERLRPRHHSLGGRCCGSLKRCSAVRWWCSRLGSNPELVVSLGELGTFRLAKELRPSLVRGRSRTARIPTRRGSLRLPGKQDCCNPQRTCVQSPMPRSAGVVQLFS